MRKIILISPKTDYVRAAYSQVIDNKALFLYEDNIICKIHDYALAYGLRVPELIYHILNRIVYFKIKINADELLVVYHGKQMLPLISHGFSDYLCKKNKVHQVWVFWDVFDFLKLDVEKIKSKVDLVVMPDEVLANNMNLTYYPLFCSKIGVEDNKSMIAHKGRVFFCGEDGGRLEKLQSIAMYFRNHNIPYDFYCANSDSNYVDKFGIKHIQRMSYSEFVQNELKNEVILDITKPGSNICTLRVCEAALYDKKLITDNKYIEHLPYYEKDNMKIFHDVSDISTEFINNPKTCIYKEKDKVYPNAFFSFLLDELEKYDAKKDNFDVL